MRLALVVLVLLAAAAPAQGAVGLVAEEGGGRSEIRTGDQPGVVTSDSTRLRGLITEDDYATGDFEIVPADDPVAVVRTLEDRIERNDRWRLPLTIALAALLIGLALVRRGLALRALLVALAANLWLSPALAVAAGAAVLLLPLGLACAAILGAYLLSMGLDAETVALSPFGPSQVGRFYGINNLLETLLLAPALAGAALLGRAGIGVAVLAFVTIGGNRFGADGGGIVVLAAAYLVLLLRLQGRRPTWRLAAAVAAGAVAIALLVLGIDAATGGTSHVTEAVGDGPAALAGDVADRIERSASRATASVGAIAVALGSLLILVGIALRARRGPLLDAFLVGIAVSVLVNDTPGDVLGMGAAIAITVARAPLWRGSLESGSMRRTAVLLTLLALLVGVAGCGGGEETAPVPQTVEGTLPEVTTTEEEAPEVEGDAARGAEIFTSAGCGGCHVLEAAGTSGTVGPNLDDSKPDFALAFTRVKNGSGAMPSFEEQLDEQQIADVAQYVVESTQG